MNNTPVPQKETIFEKLAIIGLIFGIASIVFGIFQLSLPLLPFVGIVPCILGLIGTRRNYKIMAIIGILLNIGCLLAIFIIYSIALKGAFPLDLAP